MELHNLKPAKGSIKTNNRLGRGEGSGSGDTASRGHKGAKSRSGYSRKKSFEGGQMPLSMRLPKRGFKNPNRVENAVINLARLQEIIGKHKISEVTPEILVELGIINKGERVKILGTGELSSKVTISAHAASQKASEKIAAAGGSINLV